MKTNKQKLADAMRDSTKKTKKLIEAQREGTKKTRKLVVVTRKHIRTGNRAECTCPVALALVEAGFIRPHVNQDSIRVWDREIECYASDTAPRSVSRFVSRFDSYESVKPFKFYFPTEYL